jgi:hypothetical protein
MDYRTTKSTFNTNAQEIVDKIGEIQDRNSRFKTFTLYGVPIRWIRIRPDLVAAFAAGHPAPVVGPSAAAGLEAVIAAAASPSELASQAALAAGTRVGVIGATVDTLAGTMRGLIPPLFRPIPGTLSVAIVVFWHGLAFAVSALAVSGGVASAAAAAATPAARPSQPGRFYSNGRILIQNLAKQRWQIFIILVL